MGVELKGHINSKIKHSAVRVIKKGNIRLPDCQTLDLPQILFPFERVTPSYSFGIKRLQKCVETFL